MTSASPRLCVQGDQQHLPVTWTRTVRETGEEQTGPERTESGIATHRTEKAGQRAGRGGVWQWAWTLVGHELRGPVGHSTGAVRCGFAPPTGCRAGMEAAGLASGVRTPGPGNAEGQRLRPLVRLAAGAEKAQHWVFSRWAKGGRRVGRGAHRLSVCLRPGS